MSEPISAESPSRYFDDQYGNGCAIMLPDVGVVWLSKADAVLAVMGNRSDVEVILLPTWELDWNDVTLSRARWLVRGAACERRVVAIALVRDAIRDWL